MGTSSVEKQDLCLGRQLRGMLALAAHNSSSRMALFGLLIGMFLLQLCRGASADGNVTLESIELATTHEWLGKPTVYFSCQGEDKVYLPDVTAKHELYNFTGLESFQPLTSLEGPKCKRCGFYEEDKWKGDDVFHEWELCPSSFSPAPENRHAFSHDHELNVSLLCPGCHPDAPVMSASPPASVMDTKEAEHTGTSLIVGLVILGVVVLVGVSAGFFLYRKKQREEQHKRFIQLFEDDDDLDEELGLKDDL